MIDYLVSEFYSIAMNKFIRLWFYVTRQSHIVSPLDVDPYRELCQVLVLIGTMLHNYGLL